MKKFTIEFKLFEPELINALIDFESSSSTNEQKAITVSVNSIFKHFPSNNQYFDMF